MLSRRGVVLSVLFVLSVISSSVSAFAQGGAATLNGRVTDPSGLAVVGAKVEAVNVNTNAIFSAESGPDGFYNIPALSAGTYRVSAAKEGFQQVVKPNVELNVAETVALNFALEVGSVSQSVTVESTAPLVDTTTSSLGGLVNGDKISELPLNGRNYIDLTLLQPGVEKLQSHGTQFGETGTWFSSNGATVRSNNYTLDGGSVGNMLGGVSGSLAGTTLGVDGIQEYRVITTSFSAEYGMTMGGQVIMVSKRGSNQFHGDVFEYLRNDKLDAANYFDKPLAVNNFQRLPPFKRNNFGGSFGGPIRKDKTFFYAVYEGLRQSLGTTTVDNVLNTTCYDGSGNLLLTNNPCAVTAGNPNGNVLPAVVKLVELYPTPNLGTHQFTFPSSDPTSVNYGQIRGDEIFSDSDSFFARYTTDRSNASTGQTGPSMARFPEYRKGFFGSNQFGTLSENHVFSPTLVNTARLSFGRGVIDIEPVFPFGTSSLEGPGLSFLSSAPNNPAGSINIQGLSSIGPPSAAPLFTVQNIFNLSDDLYMTKGKHNLKFGTLINRINDAFTANSSLDGDILFTSATNFLNGIPQSYSGAAPGFADRGSYTFYTYGFYAQDDWRATSHLTLNLGLRYEFRTTPHEVNNDQYSLRNPAVDATSTQGPVLRNPSLYNFSPRLGFAWDVTGGGKTAVRGAFGVYYDLASGMGQILQRNEQALPPTSDSAFALNSTGQALTIPFTFVPGDFATSLHTASYNSGQPHDFQGNLTIEQQLPGGVGLSVSYVGLRGDSLFTVVEGNPVPPTSVTNGVPFWGSPAISAGCEGTVLVPSQPPPVPLPCRTNPNFAFINMIYAGGNSWYNALQVNLNKRLARGLEFQGAYTYSKNLDTTSGITYADDCTAPGGTSSLDPNPRNAIGPACNDVTHNFRFNLLYHFPNIKSGGFLSKFTNGWWMGNIISIQSGYPFQALVGNNRSNSGVLGGDAGDAPDLGTTTTTVSLPSPSNPAVNIPVTFVPYNKNTVITGNPNEWFNVNMFQLAPNGFLGNEARDSLRGPGLRTWDFSLVKDTGIRALGEKGNLEFRAEFFNILNHPNFDLPLNGYIYPGNSSDIGPYSEAPDPSAAAITDTVTTSRQIQFSLKLIF